MGFYLSRPLAVAHISGAADGPTGDVSFYPYSGNTLVVADIRRLPHRDAPCASGVFGFHIHEGGSCGGVGFSDTKGHFNPGGVRIRIMQATSRHCSNATAARSWPS